MAYELTYNLIDNDTAYEVTGAEFNGESVAISIPDTYDNKPITRIADEAFYNCGYITGISIGRNIRTIGACAFYYCTTLSSISISNGLTHIGDEAFYGCSLLSTVVIPISVASIGYNAFEVISQLRIYCEAPSKPLQWNEEWCGHDCELNFGYNNITSNATYDYVVHDSNATLTQYKGTSLEITIPSTIEGYVVTSFGGIFTTNDTISSVVIPDSVTSIGSFAFYNCTSLTSVTIGNGVTSIGTNAFNYCINLTSVTIGNSVTSIGDSAFYDCHSLASITIPDSVTIIGSSAFLNCIRLAGVTIGNSVTSIGAFAFQTCESLTSITIPNSVTSIGSRAFRNCNSLKSVTIGSSVASIGNQALDKCPALERIILLSTTPASLGSDCFVGISGNAKFYCYYSALEKYKTATNWKTYAGQFIADDMRLYFTMNAMAQKKYFATKEELNTKPAVVIYTWGEDD